jgi:hypothetical protein
MRRLLLAAAALGLSACGTFGPSYSDLKPGATKAQVIAAMSGCPSTVVKRGNYEARTYAARMPSFFQWAPSTYTFILKDDVLVQFGEGTAREAATADGPGYELVPLPKA